MTPKTEVEGAVLTSRPSLFQRLPDALTLESISRRLHLIAASERVTSNEAQWIIRARDAIDMLEAEIKRAELFNSLL